MPANQAPIARCRASPTRARSAVVLLAYVLLGVGATLGVQRYGDAGLSADEVSERVAAYVSRTNNNAPVGVMTCLEVAAPAGTYDCTSLSVKGHLTKFIAVVDGDRVTVRRSR